jgi:hypothetical protein
VMHHQLLVTLLCILPDATVAGVDVVPKRHFARGAWRSANHTRVFGKRDAHPVYFGSNVGDWLLDLLRKRANKHKDIYEFGVYTGSRMREFATKIKGFGHMYGFDSFTGFPNEATGLWVPSRHWAQGGDSASDALKLWDASTLLQNLRSYIRYEETSFIVGYYNESLTRELRASKPFKPALLVDLDCDLYISTVQALNWMFQSGLIVPETLVRYDDWTGNKTNSAKEQAYFRRRGIEAPPEVWGQMKAHIEATDAFQVEWKRLNRKVFEVVSIGQRARSALDAQSYAASCITPPCDLSSLSL